MLQVAIARRRSSGLRRSIIGLVKPIGMFGFLAALLATGSRRGGADRARRARSAIAAPAPFGRPSQWRDGRALRFLYLPHAPRPARAGAGARSTRSARSCRRSSRRSSGVETLDPDAQDARRLMSIHLPGLIDRYLRRARRPTAANRTAKARRSTSGWSKGLAAGRAALARNFRAAGARRTWPRSKPRAASSSRATARQPDRRARTPRKTLRPSLRDWIAPTRRSHDNNELIAAGADGDAACPAQCRTGR